MSEIKIGDKLQDFRLRDKEETEVHIDFAGKKVLLSFHPPAWTNVCGTDEITGKNYETFTSLNTVAFGISVDTMPSKKAWAKELGIKHIKLLYDKTP